MIADRILTLKTEISQIAKSCGRDPSDIKLLAVSKAHKVEDLKVALANGVDCFAESRVQECEVKIPLLEGLYKEFHFIGHLQRNKINKLLSMKPTLIHSIEKFATAEKINNALDGTTQDILIEVNTSGEIEKQGCHPMALKILLQRIDELPNVRVKGLMTIGAYTEDKELIRDCFRELRYLAEEAKQRQYRSVEMKYLSMGMSGDYQIAIEEGANILRIGSLIFQHREKKRGY